MGRSGHWSGPMEEYILRAPTIIHLYIYIYIYLRNWPAHIVQRPTGKTPGAPDGQSAPVIQIMRPCTGPTHLCLMTEEINEF